MLTLIEIQGALREAILASPSPELLEEVVSDRVSARERLRVYRNHYRLSLEEGLNRAFPATRILLGARYFAAMAALFITRHPPQEARLCTYGGEFPRFLAGREELESVPFTLEVARLEWTMTRIAALPDAPALPRAALTRVLRRGARDGDDALRFTLASALTLLRWPWPVHRIRARVLAGDGAEAVSGLLDVDTPTVLLLHRDRDGDLCEVELDTETGAIVAALADGRALSRSSLVHALAADDALGALITFLFETGLVAGLSSTTLTPIPSCGGALTKEIPS
jgi:hypothetical protein